VVVHNQSDAIDSPEARCPTHPHIGGLTVGQRALHVVDSVNEGQPVNRVHVQFAYLVVDGAIGSEGFLPLSTLSVSPDISQGLDSDIERNEVGSKEGQDAIDVLIALA
jgi:hypothetical protein